ncbi:hypothetical protein BD311DRAFT_750119 [Dichomitus squalens]|uniref:Uncharacterized protein n=1 Tax=Dichomitus squalens TaxID=114155 RepID=A0A4Q9MY85_9APHY|nr:hypothetical protein BD311DRAFT_750119 [Dichomitus squalens]
MHYEIMPAACSSPDIQGSGTEKKARAFGRLGAHGLHFAPDRVSNRRRCPAIYNTSRSIERRLRFWGMLRQDVPRWLLSNPEQCTKTPCALQFQHNQAGAKVAHTMLCQINSAAGVDPVRSWTCTKPPVRREIRRLSSYLQIRAHQTPIRTPRCRGLDLQPRDKR